MALDPFRELAKSTRGGATATDAFVSSMARLLGTAGPLTLFIKRSVSAYSDYEETLNRFTAAFRSRHEEMMDVGQRFAAAYGESATTAVRMLSDSAVVFRNLGFSARQVEELSQQVNVLASDLTSFRDVSRGATYTNQQLMAGMMGHTRQLLNLGIAIRQREPEFERLVRSVQRAEGVTYAQARALAVLQESLNQSAIAEGDYARNADSLSNTQRRLSAAFLELQRQVGSDFAPVVKDAIEALTGVTRALSEMDPAVRKNITVMGLYFGVWASAAIMIKGVLPFLAGFKTVVAASGAAAIAAAKGPVAMGGGMTALTDGTNAATLSLKAGSMAVSDMSAKLSALAAQAAETGAATAASLSALSAGQANLTNMMSFELPPYHETVLGTVLMREDLIRNRSSHRAASAAIESPDIANRLYELNQVEQAYGKAKGPAAEFLAVGYSQQRDELKKVFEKELAAQTDKLAKAAAVMTGKVSAAPNAALDAANATTTWAARDAAAARLYAARSAATRTTAARSAAAARVYYAYDDSVAAIKATGSNLPATLVPGDSDYMPRITDDYLKAQREAAKKSVRTINGKVSAAVKKSAEKVTVPAANMAVPAGAVKAVAGRFMSALFGPVGMITGAIATVIWTNREAIDRVLAPELYRAGDLSEEMSKALDQIMEQRKQASDDLKTFAREIRSVQRDEIAFLTENLPVTLRLNALRQQLSLINRDLSAFRGPEVASAQLKLSQTAYSRALSEKARIDRRLGEISAEEAAIGAEGKAWDVVPGPVVALGKWFGGIKDVSSSLGALTEERAALEKRRAEITVIADRASDEEARLLAQAEDVKTLLTQRLTLLRDQVSMERDQETAQQAITDAITKRAMAGRSAAVQYAQARKEATEAATALRRADSLPVAKLDPKRYAVLDKIIAINKAAIKAVSTQSLDKLKALPLEGRAKDLINKVTTYQDMINLMTGGRGLISRQSDEAKQAVDSFFKVFDISSPEIKAAIATASMSLRDVDPAAYAQLILDDTGKAAEAVSKRLEALRSLTDARRDYINWFADRRPAAALKQAALGYKQSFASIKDAISKADPQQAFSDFQQSVYFLDQMRRLTATQREEYMEAAQQSYRQRSISAVEVGSQEAQRLRSRAVDANPAAREALKRAAAIDNRLEAMSQQLDKVVNRLLNGVTAVTVENGVSF